jgi:hypothetical protein
MSIPFQLTGFAERFFFKQHVEHFLNEGFDAGYRGGEAYSIYTQKTAGTRNLPQWVAPQGDPDSGSLLVKDSTNPR